MTESILIWLAKHFETDKRLMQEALTDEKATSFLLVWPIMEQKLFNGFMRKGDIAAQATSLSNYYNEFDIKQMIRHFHERYQEKACYKHLKHKDNDARCDKIVAAQLSDLTQADELYFMLYVVYRYRNNIFHGNKGIKSWSQYSIQIDYCINFMMQIVDCFNKNIGGRTA